MAFHLGKPALLFLCLNLAACSRYTDIEEVGALRLTKHMSRDLLRWEGGTTSLRYSTLCSQISNVCLQDHSFHISRPRAKDPRWVVVTSINGKHEHEFRRQVYFFDTTTGERVSCTKCPASLEELLAADSSIFVWGANGDRAAVAYEEDRPHHTVFMLLHFSAAGITATLLPSPGPGTTPLEARFAPDDSVVAWYECGPECVLHWYRLRDRSTGLQETPCPYNSYLDIGWENGMPRAQFYWGVSPKDMCFDAEGKPALPTGVMP